MGVLIITSKRLKLPAMSSTAGKKSPTSPRNLDLPFPSIPSGALSLPTPRRKVTTGLVPSSDSAIQRSWMLPRPRDLEPNHEPNHRITKGAMLPLNHDKWPSVKAQENDHVRLDPQKAWLELTKWHFQVEIQRRNCPWPDSWTDRQSQAKCNPTSIFAHTTGLTYNTTMTDRTFFSVLVRMSCTGTLEISCLGVELLPLCWGSLLKLTPPRSCATARGRMIILKGTTPGNREVGTVGSEIRRRSRRFQVIPWWCVYWYQVPQSSSGASREGQIKLRGNRLLVGALQLPMGLAMVHCKIHAT